MRSILGRVPDVFDHLLQLLDVAHHQHAIVLGDDARLGQRGQLARHLLAIGADLACDVGMFGRGIDARLVVLDPCVSRESTRSHIISNALRTWPIVRIA